MKNGKKLFNLPVFAAVFLLYLSDVMIATASAQPSMRTAGELSSEQEMEEQSGREGGNRQEASGKPGAEVQQGTQEKPEGSAGTETAGKPGESAGTGTAGKPGESAGTGTAGQPGESAGTGTAGKPGESAGTGTAGKPGESAGTGTAGKPGESAGTGTAGKPGESAGTETVGQLEESAMPGAAEQQGQSGESAAPGAAVQSVVEPDFVSTGAELMAWLDAHEHTGGSVELTEDIVLEGSCVFVLAGSSPEEHILVDTAGHTITVSGWAEFWSNGYLTFRGQADAYGIFRVAEGGALSMIGISVESGQYTEEQTSENARQYALWQEEGSGLVVDDCRIAGDIRYADTPFILYKESVYVLVEAEQTAADVLPAEIKCSVNYQGKVSSNKPVQVTWNLSGTEEQQEKRLRFSVQGSFSHAASGEMPVCAVVYHDYPLTLTDVDARADSSFYIFRGAYVQTENLPPMQVVSTYSFDGVNWLVYEDASVVNDGGTFFIGLPKEQWNTEEYPYLYICLQGEADGVQYFSNVLRYEAGDLTVVEDHGGSRGGGTSIIVPPEEPKKETDDAQPGGIKPPETAPEGSDIRTDVGAEERDKSGAGTEADAKENEDGSAGAESEGNDGSAGTGAEAAGNGKGSAGTGAEAAGNGKGSGGTGAEAAGNDDAAGMEAEIKGNGNSSAGTGAKADENGGNNAGTGIKPGGNNAGTDSAGTGNLASADLNENGKTSEPESESNGSAAKHTDNVPRNAVSKAQGLAAGQGGRQSRTIIIVSVFVVLSAAAGAAGFCFHAGVFRRFLRAVRKLFR